MLKSSHEFIGSRDTHFTVPIYPEYFDSAQHRRTFDFFFKVNIPKVNKERIITERDDFGRILSSKVPELYIRDILYTRVLTGSN